LTLAAAVAVAKALADLGCRPDIKWPNDVFLDGRKVCGILVETHSDRSMGRCAVVGIGVNVNQLRRDLPSALRRRATSIRIHLRKACNRANLLAGILEQWDRIYGWIREGETGKVLSFWRRYSSLPGKQVRVTRAARVEYAQALHADEKGGLWLRNDTGMIERVEAGDVEMLEMYRAGRRRIPGQRSSLVPERKRTHALGR
jgi:BirA family transcriptional regulator, biotin operon repressor / biotin---[acetyl-CoA-carboxylase] ligase